MEFAEIAALVVFGGLVGCYGTMIGAGGGFVLIPGLVLLFGFEGVEAVGTGAVALAAIGITGTISYDRQGLVDRRAAAWFSVIGLPVAIFAGWKLADRVDSELFVAALGFVLLALGIFVLASAGRSVPAPAAEPPFRASPLVVSGAGLGLLSGMFAVGSGLLTVPVMARVRGHNAHRAAATTTATVMVTSIAGTIGRALADNIDWPAAALLAGGAAVGSNAGARMAGQFSERLMLALLASGLFGAGIPLLVRML